MDITYTLQDCQTWDVERGMVEGHETVTAKTTYVIHWKHLKKFFTSPAVTYADIMGYVAHRKKEGATGQTVRKELQTLRRGLKEARKRGHAMVAPEDWPRIKSDEKSKQRAGKRWPLETFKSWLDLLPQHVRDELLFDFLTGLRYGELKNARFSWVKASPPGSAAPAILHVPPGAGKDKSRGREIGLSVEALAIVERMGEMHGGVGLIFAKGDHKRHYEVARKMLGLEMNITRRDCRHMFASIALEHSQDPTAVMELMGHKDLTTTSRYLHSKLSRTVAAASEVSAAFFLDQGAETPVKGAQSHLGRARLAQLDRASASGAETRVRAPADTTPWADPQDVILLTR